MDQGTRRPTALVIEDDAAVRGMLEHLLRHLGVEPTVAEDGRRGLDLALGDEAFDVILLDLVLPHLPGVAVLEELRARGVTTPVIVISGHLETDTRRAVAVGASMVLQKPFDAKELAIWVGKAIAVARVRGAIRRMGDLVLDLERSRVTRDGSPLRLTPLDFHLLVKLTDRAGELVSPAELLAELWEDATPKSRPALEAEVSRLRRKLDRPGEPSHIESVRWQGYRFVARHSVQGDVPTDSPASLVE